MSDGYQVKGSSIRSKFLFVRERFGADAEEALVEEFNPSMFPLLDGKWYPYAFYEKVIHTITEEFLGGRLKRLEEVGAFSAESTLSTVYKFLAERKDFIVFLKRAEKLHESCYNKGGMKIEVGEDQKSCVIKLSAPVFREIDMHISTGFYLGAARMLGADDAKCKSTLHTNSADFAISWS